LVFRQQEAVRAIKGHKLPFLLNDFSTDDRSRGTARIHHVKLPISFRHFTKDCHRRFLSMEIQMRWIHGRCRGHYIERLRNQAFYQICIEGKIVD
jgi:hypothetical protein